MRRLALLFALVAPSTALATGAGGPMARIAVFPGSETSWRQEAPIGVVAVGGMGFGRIGPLRIGGEASVGGNRDVTNGELGLQVGWLGTFGRFHLTAYGVLGAGALNIEGDDYDLTVGYGILKPTAGVGWSLGRVILEGSAWIGLPVHPNPNGEGLTVAPPQIGTQLTVLFGNINRRPRAAETARPEAANAALPPEEVNAGRDRPLAIPGGEPPPPR